MRITHKNLDTMVDNLNTVLGLPTPWTKTADGLKANPGSFVLDAAYNGYRLALIINDAGGESDMSGFCTARELWQYLNGMMMGLDSNRQVKWAKEFAAKAEAEAKRIANA